MPRTVFDRIAHLWSAQHFGLFWGFDIHNPSGETNACAGFDCSHRLSAQGFEFVGSWISTTHSTLGVSPANSPRHPIDSSKKPAKQGIRRDPPCRKQDAHPSNAQGFDWIGVRVVHMPPTDSGKNGDELSALDYVLENNAIDSHSSSPESAPSLRSELTLTSRAHSVTNRFARRLSTNEG
ncbi:hypothetical protein L2Y90_08490 [Burkholderia pyrrocinia]|uniref:hypothetical protein n=1 Tax=Burkholderia pyrrocinia TaxID=60550 RepID=UPI00215A606E|nr:hypothetical protein [Burkholderia pyrrocinia]UVE67134.1 hypothetical protein L2Y90_08490 [Burkholderia pyrrocinia]